MALEASKSTDTCTRRSDHRGMTADVPRRDARWPAAVQHVGALVHDGS